MRDKVTQVDAGGKRRMPSIRRQVSDWLHKLFAQLGERERCKTKFYQDDTQRGGGSSRKMFTGVKNRGAAQRWESARSWRTLLCALGVLIFRFEERINAKEEFSLEVGRDPVELHFGRKLRLIELGS
jgi:hypothetical protein